jgi:3-hydroxyacyl-[acyl-carrier-protein] dehydratase
MMEKALSFLPHGPEFRFLDRLTALEPGKTGRAEYRIRGDEPFLRGHFPGEPIFPGVLLVEAAAQLAGVVAQSDPVIPPLAGLKLAALRQVKILGAAKPGETLELEAQITGRMGNLIQAKASARVAGAVVMTAELTLAGSDRPKGYFAGDYGHDKERVDMESAMGKVKQKPER